MYRSRLWGGLGVILGALCAAPAVHAQGTPASQTLFVLTGNLPETHLGAVGGGVGDLNGDSRADLLVGNESQINAYSGANQQLLYTIPADQAGDFQRATIQPVGDLDGDSRPEILVAAPLADQQGRADAGAVYLFSGATGQRIRALFGSTAGAQFGASVALVGDLSGDNSPEAVIGAPGALSDTGTLTVVSLANGAVLRTARSITAGVRLGSGLAAVGDLNGDGRTDIAVGAPLYDPQGRTDAGRVVFYSPATGQTLGDISGAEANTQLGASLAAAGDLNGDSRVDLVIGAPGRQVGDRAGAGVAFVYSIATSKVLFRLEGGAAGDAFGSVVIGGSDVDGDGRPDMAVGAPLADVEGRVDAGLMQVFSGADGKLLLTLAGNAGDQLGSALAFIGDVSNDQRADILLGAPLFDILGAPNAGAAAVVSFPGGNNGGGNGNGGGGGGGL